MSKFKRMRMLALESNTADIAKRVEASDELTEMAATNLLNNDDRDLEQAEDEVSKDMDVVTDGTSKIIDIYGQKEAVDSTLADDTPISPTAPLIVREEFLCAVAECGYSINDTSLRPIEISYEEMTKEPRLALEALGFSISGFVNNLWGDVASVFQRLSTHVQTVVGSLKKRNDELYSRIERLIKILDNTTGGECYLDNTTLESLVKRHPYILANDDAGVYESLMNVVDSHNTFLTPSFIMNYADLLVKKQRQFLNNPSGLGDVYEDAKKLWPQVPPIKSKSLYDKVNSKNATKRDRLTVDSIVLTPHKDYVRVCSLQQNLDVMEAAFPQLVVTTINLKSGNHVNERRYNQSGMTGLAIKELFKKIIKNKRTFETETKKAERQCSSIDIILDDLKTNSEDLDQLSGVKLLVAATNEIRVGRTSVIFYELVSKYQTLKAVVSICERYIEAYIKNGMKTI